ncbi:MAG: hypothetical protein AB1558_09310 [Thermodesulfobacteriota bacterium]
MGMINLADAKISYEGQTLPAIHLISRLQAQLRESACRIATIAETLGDLQTALLSFQTVEVKLTLSKEEYDRFKRMEGADDGERIYKAVMTAIHPGQVGASGEADAPRTPASAPESSKLAPPVESAPVTEKPAEPERPQAPEPQAAGNTFPAPGITPAFAQGESPTTRCPTCQSVIDLPETSRPAWPLQIKCENCGGKSIVSPPSMRHWTNYMTVISAREAATSGAAGTPGPVVSAAE